MRSMTTTAQSASLVIAPSLVSRLMKLYDYPHPTERGKTIRGYDRPHAVRTARMCAAVSSALGHGPERVRQYQIACLLHDLGRAGLDRRLFGKIWSWAKSNGIPTRPREWRAIHPETTYGRETEAFVRLYSDDLASVGVDMTPWAREQVEMRLGYARRLARRLRSVRPSIKAMGVRWESWMQLVMLYYYYPERLKGAKSWVRQLAEVLVACEQFEAYSNQRRGRDYYVRNKETIVEAFAYLEQLRKERILSSSVMNTMKQLAAGGTFDDIIAEARGRGLTPEEKRRLRNMDC
ncbi:hypothetical protein W02_32240 [Nitrospira sp. KM1]|uniref:hypothetical protein n=1 Tax=Nitrospira sp. KM1 TaxID=1936990 RepID=UPI0013A74109|nr:hypothetical protein [Nitrospira sp. KM1]BCA56084.1 hypothetical protein W02_32240 [Nitrospira sp. KM1]